MKSDEDLDRVCVERCLKGDLDAFATLIDRYQRPLFNAVLHVVRDPEDAREVCQQVFMKIYQHLASYDPQRKFFSWIYRTAMNESINHLKARHAWEPLNEQMETSIANPAERFEAMEASRTVQEAVMALETNYRIVVVLRHFLHFSYEEAAELLNVPARTVKSRLFTARQLLRKWLETKGELGRPRPC